MTAAFGNFNAGYTGTYANVPEGTQFRLAGLGEVSKPLHDGSDNGDNRGWQPRMGEILWGIPPYADQRKDYWWNCNGMYEAKKERR